jgi:DNA-binding NarL/FixJ family response regulator
VITVLVADDQALVRGGFHAILDAQADVEVVGEAADGHEAVEMALRLRPDIVLLDIRMPRMDGIEVTRKLSATAGWEGRVVILSTFDLDEYVYGALKAGASGFLLKTVPPRQLVAAVRDVAHGDALLAPAITQRLIEQFVSQPMPGADARDELRALTARELDVMRIMARGCTNADIARQLVVSESTAKTHVARILSKLHLRDRAQAVVLAYETGLVRPGQSNQPS